MAQQQRDRIGSIGLIVGMGLAAKFFIDTSVQLYNPFLTIYAAGLGISAVTMGKLVSLRNVMGLAAPLFGSVADRIGYRPMMRLALLLTGLGMLILATGANMAVLIIGMVVCGLGQSGYTPNIQAYLSSKLPYEKRSRFLGILEYAWAMAGIVGLSLMGLLIEWFSWRVPLIVIGGGLITAAALFRFLPIVQQRRKDAGEPAEAEQKTKTASSEAETEEAPPCDLRERLCRLRAFFYLGEHQLSAWAAVLVNTFNFFAIFHIMIIHGGWLEQSYGLRAGELGGVALLMGIFDWAASILVSVAGDRIGKRRSVILGVAGIALFSGLLPLFDRGLVWALAGLMLVRFSFEFATVSNFPLLSEQFPSKRGKVMSFSLAGGLIGTTVAATTGPAAFFRFGVWGLGPVSLASAALSLLLLHTLVREQPHRAAASGSSVEEVRNE
jgi:MFS family permease